MGFDVIPLNTLYWVLFWEKQRRIWKNDQISGQVDLNFEKNIQAAECGLGSLS